MNKFLLIVEDDEAIRSSLTDLLEMEGYEIHAVENGEEALGYLQSCSALPDAILLDLMMPVMDGFTFCEEKAKQTEVAHIPVIVMSADGHVRDKQNRTGATAYIKKPLDIEDLLSAVENCFIP